MKPKTFIPLLDAFEKDEALILKEDLEQTALRIVQEAERNVMSFYSHERLIAEVERLFHEQIPISDSRRSGLVPYLRAIMVQVLESREVR